MKTGESDQKESQLKWEWCWYYSFPPAQWMGELVSSEHLKILLFKIDVLIFLIFKLEFTFYS